MLLLLRLMLRGISRDHYVEDYSVCNKYITIGEIEMTLAGFANKTKIRSLIADALTSHSIHENRRLCLIVYLLSVRLFQIFFLYKRCCCPLLLCAAMMYRATEQSTTVWESGSLCVHAACLQEHLSPLYDLRGVQT